MDSIVTGLAKRVSHTREASVEITGPGPGPIPLKSWPAYKPPYKNCPRSLSTWFTVWGDGQIQGGTLRFVRRDLRGRIALSEVRVALRAHDGGSRSLGDQAYRAASRDVEDGGAR